MLSLAEENYLKAILHLEQSNGEGVSTNAIAEKLDSKPSSVTDMVQKLADKGLLVYVKYRGTSMTEKGRLLAMGIIRKHRLWETFLVNKLKFQWDEVHDIAEQLEHIQSEDLVDRLDAFLGYPGTDPHGDPIPDKHGQVKKMQKKLLSSLDIGQSGVCVGVKNSDDDFLKFLNKKNISIGSEIQVLAKEEFDDSLQMRIEDQTFYVSKTISENLYIKCHEPK